jgi:hypothetical protein
VLAVSVCNVGRDHGLCVCLCRNRKRVVWKDMKLSTVVCVRGGWYCTYISWFVGSHECLGCCSECQTQRHPPD